MDRIMDFIGKEFESKPENFHRVRILNEGNFSNVGILDQITVDALLLKVPLFNINNTLNYLMKIQFP